MIENLEYNIIKGENYKTICHIGSYDGLEAEDYYSAGIKKIIWVEANINILNKLIKKTSQYDLENIYLPLTLSDVDDQIVEFNITTNGESSSFMEIGDLHKKAYPEILITKSIKTLTKRLDNYVNNQNDFNWAEVDMLVIDCQGADLKVLQGCGDLLKSPNLKMIKCEVNFGDMYVGGPSEDDINDFLTNFGYHKSYWFIVDNGTWGNTYWSK